MMTISRRFFSTGRFLFEESQGGFEIRADGVRLGCKGDAKTEAFQKVWNFEICLDRDKNILRLGRSAQNSLETEILKSSLAKIETDL